MTAEIAILNRSGVALAADSAVTVGRQRVWKSTNKLFSLGPTNDIGLMIYGAGDHAGHPWEILIKLFREEVAGRKFSKVGDAMSAFFEFIGSDRFSDDELDDLNALLLFLRVLKNLQDDLKSKGKLEIRTELIRLAERERSSLDQKTIVFQKLSLSEFRKSYGIAIKACAKEVFSQAIPKSLFLSLSRYLFETFRRSETESGYESGVIFAGYGQSENFPVVIHCVVDGKYNKKPRWWKARESDLNADRRTRGMILPFAQSDIAYLFMEGVSVGYIPYIQRILTDILAAKSNDIVSAYVRDADERAVERRRQELDDEKLVDRLVSEFADFRRKSLIDPVMEVVASLPKEEMAAMAEAIVELTSLRRKIDSRLESVAGPVDVAVISKGDGFIWVKRKHYFSLDFNPDFLTRRSYRFGGGIHEQNEQN